jgi:signal transduction histidine kinase/response regulator RpfG family c-di-GMP phosphodiesterase
MTSTMAIAMTFGLGALSTPGGLVPWVGLVLMLGGAMVWQVRRLREHSRRLSDRHERVQGLESILRISARMHAFHDVDHLLNEVADAVRRSLGFRMVLVRIYDPLEKTFDARAYAGIDETGREYLRNLPLTLAEFRQLTLPQFQISNSYYIAHDAKGAAELMSDGYVPDLGQRNEGEWDERDMLIVPLTSPEGEISGYLSVDDPVDRKCPSERTIERLETFAQQAATAISSAELYSRLHRQNRDLVNAADRLRYHNDLKNNFVANVSHELRTPLTSIKAYCEALLHGRSRMDEGAQQEFLRVIDLEAEKLTGIVNNLLDLERMEGTQVRFNRHQTDLVALVRGVEGAARSQAEAKDISLSVHFDHDEIPLWVDADLVRQLMRHLLDNAFKFTPAGGAVHLSLLEGVSSVRICVEDNGVGIPDNKMSYIFDRFYQVDGSSTREHGGQGIGLAICRDIVTRHGGRIWGERMQPHGVRFNALLPRKDEIVKRDNVDQGTFFEEFSDFAERLIQWIGELMRVKIVSLMMPDRTGEHLVIEAAMGLEDHVVQNTRLKRGEGIAGRVWRQGEAILVEDDDAESMKPAMSAHQRYSTGSLLSAPVTSDGKVVAVVNVNNRLDGQSFSNRDRLLLESLAMSMGSMLMKVRNHAVSTRSFTELHKALRKGIAVRRARHDELAEICHEVCLRTARRLRVEDLDLKHLAFALQTYDLGLSGVPDEVLYKSPPLEPEEWEIIQQHVHTGLEMVEHLDAAETVKEAILHHHEHYDGNGYPNRLVGDTIPLGARLLALADALTAMLQGRPYRPALRLDDALAEMSERSGSQFCPRCLAVFLEEAREFDEAVAHIQSERSLALSDNPIDVRVPDPVSSGG